MAMCPILATFFLLDSKAIIMFQFFYVYIGYCSWFLIDVVGYWLPFLVEKKATIKEHGLNLWLQGKQKKTCFG